MKKPLRGVYVSAHYRENFYKAVKYYVRKRDKFIANVMKEVADIKFTTIENDPRHLMLLTISTDMSDFCDKTLKSEDDAQQKLISEKTLEVCRRVSRMELFHDVDALRDLVAVYPAFKGQLCQMLQLCLDKCGFLTESIKDAERCFNHAFNETVQTMGFPGEPEDCVNDPDSWSELDEEDKKTAKEIRDLEKEDSDFVDDEDDEDDDDPIEVVLVLDKNRNIVDVLPKQE
jgi:hypothetical protein